MRFAHFLGENRGTELPQCCIWVDTETKPKRRSKDTVSHHLWFGWACYSRTRALDDWLVPSWIRFVKPAQFWNWVESNIRPKTRMYLFAHSWGFDAPVLKMFEELPKRGWKLTKAVIECPPVILRWSKDTSTILVLDTLNWYRMALAQIGKSVGISKLEMPKRTAPLLEWYAYGKRDVEVIHRVMMEWFSFLRAHDLGSFGPTLASQAIRAYRHRFLSHRILIDSNPKALLLARDSLHGGRVECFRLGKLKGPIHVFDVNSMYPFVMRDNLYPARLLLYTTQVSLPELSKWLKTRCVIARVRLKTKRARFAHVFNDRLVFPVGRFIEPLTTPDLIDALSHGEIDSIIDAAVYTAEPIFNKFVTEIYALRKKATDAGDSVRSWLLKILMNSLYGKFAQRGTVWEIVRAADDLSIQTWEELDYESGALRKYRQFGGVVQTLSKQPEGFDSHPAIASHVTAYARSHLYHLMESFGKAAVLYVDTDSLYLRALSRSRLAELDLGSGLGGLKLEGTFPWIHLRGPKDYAVPEKEVIKGIRKSAVATSDNAFTQEQWSSLVGLIAAGDLGAPTIKQVSKMLARNYSKGTVASDGHVLPFVLNEW